MLRSWAERPFAAVLSLLVLAAGATGIVKWIVPDGDGIEDRTGPSLLRSLTDLNQYTAASGYYETVVDIKDDSGWLPDVLAGERILYVAKGDVDAFVDFSQLDVNHLALGDDGSVTISLPTPEVAEPHLDIEGSRVYSHDKGLAAKVAGSDFERQAQLKAIEQMTTAATEESLLLDRAEVNTETMLRGLLGALGHTDVTITFDE